MSLKLFIRRLAPRWLMSFYHWVASYTVALVYGLPARQFIVIGITGTKGKTTTATMLWHILRAQGFKTALLTTAQISVGQELKLNEWKMTMPGRAILQKFFKQACAAGCTHVILEVSSEGLAQGRQAGIKFQVGVFTNLTPEHIEAHGSLANYIKSKAKLFSRLRAQAGTAVINLDDPQADYFIKQAGAKVIGYTLHNFNRQDLMQVLPVQALEIEAQAVVFKIAEQIVKLPVGGKFNIYNAAAAIAAAQALGLAPNACADSLNNFIGTPGRLEYIKAGQNFKVVVDYAHTAESLEAVYELLQDEGKLIAVLGSCGGGRDKQKRAVLGRLAGVYADYVVVTNEDPYDEDPTIIMQTVAQGALAAGKILYNNLFILPDRRLAVAKALSLARPGDTVVITGKGAEQWLCVAQGKKIPWDDRVVAREELSKLELRIKKKEEKRF